LLHVLSIFLDTKQLYQEKHRTPSYIPEHVLRELHLPPFKSAINAGARSIMINSGLINSIPVHSSKYILTTLLKNELGFNGVVLTDWEDINKLVDRDKIASSLKEAIKIAINAGIDMSMVPYDYEQFCENLVQLVNEGEVPMTRIDDAVSKILKLKFKLNLFEKPLSNPEDYSEFGSSNHRKKAFNSAAEAITLLKNQDNILPIKKGRNILVAGPNGNSMRTLNGAWSYSWQGEKTDQYTEKYNTIFEALKNKFGSKKVTFSPGISYPTNEDYDEEPKWEYYHQFKDKFNYTVKAAKNSDLVILCLGENSYTEKPGDLNDLTLNSLQIELANAVIKTGVPVILIINSGRPRIISKIANKVKAIVNIYLPGNYGADALASILSGEINPSGKLPYSYPLYSNSLIPYNYKPSEIQNNSQGAYNYLGEVKNLYDFGYGLSYSKFEMDNFKINKNELSKIDTLKISIDVTNTSSIKGKETIQVFSKDHYASITPDFKRLRRFKKIELNPLETKTVNFSLPINELSFVNESNNKIIEAGSFDIIINNQIQEIKVN